MSDTAVKVEHLGKKYIIGHRSSEFARFNEYLSGLGKAILRRLKNPFKPYDVSLELEDFWALRDVSFELKHGDRLGIIGLNGSGKSTLLKMLSRITAPTEGRITVNGRIASLLEVGTGFHPELTGRENIFLNGSILGMTRQEIKAKFDEIVDFSGVEKFLDTPVKRYSSGMYVRLAFAVAAHLNPEILVVDEVLAVGDAEFQKKCIGKMHDISSDSGRTILFVSHNLRAVQLLCNKGLLLNHGHMEYFGDVAQAAAQYIESRESFTRVPLGERTDRKGSGKLRFVSCAVQNSEGRDAGNLPLGEKLVLEIGVECQEEMEGEIKIEAKIFSSADLLAGVLNLANLGYISHLKKGHNTVRFEVPRNPFYPDRYAISLYAEKDEDVLDYVQNAAMLKTIDGSFQNPAVISQPYSSMVALDYTATVNGK
ncbi:MAG: ATP-binding cassette domain-containing protein [Lentisphaeria bacterium]|nr:ATP-binding cassette domain-containing protein [Lentisphaeria bacterium]